MRLLFLHPNFPGQFVRPAAVSAQAGHEVKFLCHTHYGRSLAGVERITLKGGLGHKALEARQLKGLAHTQALAEQYLKAMEQLAAAGWQPDVVVSHSGWGCGLHTALVWPQVRRVAYVEWWFAVDAPLYSFDPTNLWWPSPGNGRGMRERNLSLALELSEAHALVAPTHWQRQQLPEALRQRCAVITDGVDLNRFRPDHQRKAPTPLLTYGTRGMEPMRGFPELISELPGVLEAHPQLEVEIAGDDRICYGGSPPQEGSFGRWAQQQLAPWIAEKRVSFLGRLKPHAYTQWLQRSWLHVHLTRPFVASWSLLEAMASGCCLIASNTEPVREFLDPSSATLVDFRKEGWLMPVVAKLLADSALCGKLAKRATSTAKAFDEHKAIDAWHSLLCAGLTT
ncbi:glycosyltransferase [Cyanobium sp. ATX 6E8]|uniref:glycosyltransferase n=1 Tax=Cyanobium sp. ATX 6E8 TaxID=2823701 RepID=UPI0020CBD383|nr:glycosyltransferase [Cyanobium sp. ATX 6E8]MCP9941956.1 glycosyltransferase [Cyanobium sp. ATX 6E8]